MLNEHSRRDALERLRPWIERARTFSGWFGLSPFPDFDVRLLEPGPQWDYEAMVREMARDASAALDLGTGGGEFIADVRDSLPERVVATEEWHVNAPIAYERLRTIGVDVVWCRSLYLPFAGESFDLVIDRHEELSPAEVARVLAPGGHVATQQVGPNNWIELQRYFGDATAGNRGNSRMTDFGDIRGEYARGFESAGLTVMRDESHDYKVAYGGLGEMVFMLLITPWTIPDFDVERDLEALLELESDCSTDDGLVMTWSRFLLVAENLQLDDQAVMRRLRVDSVQVAEHVGAHVGEDEAAAGQLSAIRRKRFVVEVGPHLFVERVGLANEEVGVARGIDERIGPLGVAGIGDGLARAVDAQRVGRCTARVDDGVGRHHDQADLRGGALGQLDELDGEALLGARGPREEHLHRVADARLDARRAGDDERPCAPRDELGVQDEEGQAAEVIAVEVADEDGLDVVRIDVEAAHRDERRRAAVEQDGAGCGSDEDARLEPPAAAEGVAAAKELHRHHAGSNNTTLFS